jgi:methionyl-tRNA synthetase
VVPNFSATTPIYYVTAKPHLGHAYTTIVTDAVCRWHRLCGDDVHLLTGTDEHGLKVQQYADAAGKTPSQFVDEIAPLYADTWKRLDVRYDDFIRTTEDRHKRGVNKLLQACYDAGDIELDVYRGHYCVACEAYYTDEELVGGNCPIHNTTKAVYVEEENYFFRLSRFEQRLLDWYDQHPDAIVPGFRRNEVIGFIKGGLHDFSVSRKTLKWGIPLPWDANHVAYVWFDALANYITAHGYGTNDQQFAKRWPVDWHFIGKDIIRFHCVYWPAMLISAGIELPKGWAVGGFLLVGGEKMSKTTGNVVSPLDLVDEFGVDGFRYYVLADTVYGNDGDFTYEGLVARYNSDLANNLGNLAARVATVVEKKCGARGPAPRKDSPLAAIAADVVRDTDAAWRGAQPSRALEATWNLIRATNAHLEQHEPWKMEPGDAVDDVMGDALEALRIVVILANPALPTTTQEIWRRIGLPGRIEDCRIGTDTAWGAYPGGLTVEKGEPLFPRKKA